MDNSESCLPDLRSLRRKLEAAWSESSPEEEGERDRFGDGAPSVLPQKLLSPVIELDVNASSD